MNSSLWLFDRHWVSESRGGKLIRHLISMIRKLCRTISGLAGLPAGLAIILILLMIMFIAPSACRMVPTIITHGTTATDLKNTTSTDSSTDSSDIQPGTSSTDSSAGSSSENLTELSTSETDPLQTTVSQTADQSATITSETSAVATTHKTTVRPAATSTPKPTPTPTSAPADSPTPGSADFQYKNYGVFFREEYGWNSQIITSADGGISIDIGCVPNGVALLKVDGIPAEKRCKIIVTANSKSYSYEIAERGKYLGIPMQLGEGSYTITVYEEVADTSYSSVFAHTFDVSLASSLKPYTASSIMSDFSSGSSCVQKSQSLCSGIETATGRVDAIYRWIVVNIIYDRDLANNITSGEIKTYLPDPERTYSTRKGICLDYASLMCAMLRCQGIPTRLIFGQTPLGYHAWNEVYFAGTGWVVVASFSWEYVDGSGWVMFDTTFAAGGMTPENIQATSHTKQKTY
jgi:hypothetical protein